MVHRIEISLKDGILDARGISVLGGIRSFLGLPVESVRVRDVFKIDAELQADEIERVRREFTDPVIQESALGILPASGYDWVVVVGFNPGVTDNVGRSARIAIEDMTGRTFEPGSAVYTEVEYFLVGGGLSREDAWRAGTELIANVLIERVRVLSADEREGAPVDLEIPLVVGTSDVQVREIDLEVDDEALVEISREGTLSLSLEEMKVIQGQYRDEAIRARRRERGVGPRPTDAELECLAQTWSEHCKHKIFNARISYVEPGGSAERIDSLFDTYIRGSTEAISREVDWLVSVFHDNAGVIRFNEDLNLVFKVETHNSPSALDPYGGAMTGIVGVNRDPFGTGLGAGLLINVWGYCLGDPFYSGELPEGLLHPRRIRDGVHKGVIDGGNQSGIPYGTGWEYFDDRYLGKPLVFCGTVGVMPREIQGQPSHVKRVAPGDRIVMVGGRIGKDGIHGATFSSEELHGASPVQAVQIGNPIVQKMMTDFLLEARDLGLYSGITDNGAGGLSSSVGEMARQPGGAVLDLSLAPLKYQGLEPWEVLVSEAQERMTLAVPPSKIGAFMELAQVRLGGPRRGPTGHGVPPRGRPRSRTRGGVEAARIPGTRQGIGRPHGQTPVRALPPQRVLHREEVAPVRPRGQGPERGEALRWCALRRAFRRYGVPRQTWKPGRYRAREGNQSLPLGYRHLPHGRLRHRPGGAPDRIGGGQDRPDRGARQLLLARPRPLGKDPRRAPQTRPTRAGQQGHR
jgi:phosphoribosylformylglycinamidine synthase